MADVERDVRVGRFVSRAVDGETYRIGVGGHRFFRAIHFTDTEGNPIRRVCIIETPSDKNIHYHLKSIHTLLTILDAGRCAIEKEKASLKFLESCVHKT